VTGPGLEHRNRADALQGLSPAPDCERSFTPAKRIAPLFTTTALSPHEVPARNPSEPDSRRRLTSNLEESVAVRVHGRADCLSRTRRAVVEVIVPKRSERIVRINAVLRTQVDGRSLIWDRPLTVSDSPD
jgi:hypothetical protein